MSINIKGILVSLMAMVLVSSMMGVVYAKIDSPLQTNYTNTWCADHTDHDTEHNDHDHDDCDTEHDGHDQSDCPSNPGSRVYLQIRDQDESWRHGVNATWMAHNMVPGADYAFEGAFAGLRSNVKGGIEITCDYGVKEEIPPCEADSDRYTNLFPNKMAKQLIITRAHYTNSSWLINLLTGEPSGMSSKDQRAYTKGRSFLWKIPDVDQDGRITFYDIKYKPLTNLPLPAGTEDATRFLMSVRLASSAGNDLQGDTFKLTMLYTLNQW
jgi:hypothetical protein